MAQSLDELLTGGGTASKVAETNGVPEEIEVDHCELHGITIKPLQTLEELTPRWLSLFLNRPIDENGFTLTPVGTGQMSSTFRVTFRETEHPDAPETIVIKFASSDQETRDLGLRFQHYQREAVFYRRFGDLLSAGLNRCYGAVVDKEGWFTIALEDAGIKEGYSYGQLEGTDYEHCALALRALAQLQAPVLGNPDLDKDEWLNRPGALNQKLFNDCLPIFRKRYPPAPEHEALLDWMSEHLDAWYATRKPPFAISHGDFRLDNVMFLKKDSDRAVAVDWGGSNWASPMRDASYFLGNGLRIEDRRKWEKQLVREYFDELNRLSKVKMTWEHAWEEYARETIYGLAQHIPAAGILPDTERGKIMFRTLVTRQAQSAVDLNATSFVNTDIFSSSPAVADESEHIHPIDSSPLWSESWYFDTTAADGDLGFFARVGRLPNQDRCNFVGGIFQRNEAPIMFIDMEAPLPASDPLVQQFSTKRFRVESKCLEPLSKFAFKLNGTGSSFTDPSSRLRGEHGTDVTDVEVELIWQTSGSPFKKGAQTRYEIPCQVDGTIKIGDKSFSLKAAPGERNHSWGVRDWWVTDWVWSGLHFEDGTHIFTIALGKGSESTGASGFIQKDGKVREITSVVNEFEFQENGLPGTLKLRIEPGNLTIECETIGAAGLRLISPEGREAHLPRVMCSAKTNGGVKGVGWLDFNRVLDLTRATNGAV